MMEQQTLRGPLGWSIASIIVILLFCAYAIITVASPLLRQAKADAPKTSMTDSLVERYNNNVAVDIARFNGRSAFFNPIQIAIRREPTKQPSREIVPEPEEIIVTRGPDPAPLTYMGPPLIAIIGDEAWFRGGGSDSVIRLKSGEELDGLKVISTTPPSTATVEHRTGVYPLNLFTNEEPFFSQEPPSVISEGFLEEVEG